MRTFTIASILALSAVVAAQGEEGVSSVVDPAIGTPSAGAGGLETTPLDPAVGGGASATDSLAGSGGETPVIGGDGGSMTTALGGVGGSGGMPSAVAAFTSQNSQVVQSLLSLGAVDPSAAAIGAQSLLSSAYQNPEVSSYIANDPAWSALAAQVTGGPQGELSSLDPNAASGSGSANLPLHSSTGSQVVVTSVNTPRSPASVTSNAPKASGTDGVDAGSGAMSLGVKFGSIALALGAVVVAI